MQKRDKFGRFLKKSTAKKKSKRSNIKVQKVSKIKDISDLTLWDLKDMISAEVALQMRY